MCLCWLQTCSSKAPAAKHNMYSSACFRGHHAQFIVLDCLAGAMSTLEAAGPQGAPTPAGCYLVEQQLVALLTTGAAGDML
jgi:hypothetical protein